MSALLSGAGSVELNGTGVLKCKSGALRWILEIRTVITMLEACCPWYIFTAKQRNAANVTANFTAHFEKSRSKISHFRPQKSEKSPAKSWRDCINVYIYIYFFICFRAAWKFKKYHILCSVEELKPKLFFHFACYRVQMFFFLVFPQKLKFCHYSFTLFSNLYDFFLNLYFYLSLSIWEKSIVNIYKKSYFVLYERTKAKIV